MSTCILPTTIFHISEINPKHSRLEIQWLGESTSAHIISSCKHLASRNSGHPTARAPSNWAIDFEADVVSSSWSTVCAPSNWPIDFESSVVSSLSRMVAKVRPTGNQTPSHPTVYAPRKRAIGFEVFSSRGRMVAKVWPTGHQTPRPLGTFHPLPHHLQIVLVQVQVMFVPVRMMYETSRRWRRKSMRVVTSAHARVWASWVVLIYWSPPEIARVKVSKDQATWQLLCYIRWDHVTSNSLFQSYWTPHNRRTKDCFEGFDKVDVDPK